MATARQYIRHISIAIAPLYDSCEADAIARAVVMARIGATSLAALLATYDEECEIGDIDSLTARLAEGCPMQYVLGYSDFCGLKLRVNEDVLIPRPETAELVEKVYHSCRNANIQSRRILDVCTGSGAIALALKSLLADSRVVGVDISDKALAVATENQKNLNIDITLQRADALGDLSDMGEFDIIVSNPPYVPDSDRAAMQRNVLDYEPSLALFVPNDDPLLFYRSIARNASKMLASGGWLWFEIYEKFGKEICVMLSEMGFGGVEVIKDSFDKDRFVCCRKE